MKKMHLDYVISYPRPVPSFIVCYKFIFCVTFGVFFGRILSNSSHTVDHLKFCSRSRFISPFYIIFVLKVFDFNFHG
jgi:hypothetical protein